MQVPSGYIMFKTVAAGDLAPFLRRPPLDPKAPVFRVFRTEGTGPLVRRVLDIPPGTVGEEFHRTRGHARSLHPTAHVTYPSLARVLSGEALLWQQRSTLAPEAVSDFLVCRVKAGESALLLPDFAQGFVNDTQAPVWVEIAESPEVRHDHEPIRRFQGPAYYPVSRKGALEWVANVRYSEITTPRWVAPRESPELGIRFQGHDLDEKTTAWLLDPSRAFEDLSKAYDYFTEGFRPSGG